MDLKVLAIDFSNTLGRGCSSSIIRDAARDLEKLAAELKYQQEMGTADPDLMQAVQVKIARRGLELQQRDVPLLADLARQIFQVAGQDAIKFALTPVTREGTDRQGNPMPPIPSDFVHPTKFKRRE